MFPSNLPLCQRPDPDDDEPMATDFALFKAMKAFNMAGLGTWGVHTLIDLWKLKPFYEYYMDWNPSRDLPYHNQYHTLRVFMDCYEGMFYSRMRNHTIEDAEARGLCAGALFHDWDHSGGGLDDEQNLARALAGLQEANKYAASCFYGLSVKEYQIATACIRVTKNPIMQSPLELHERLIHDAEMMQPYEENEDRLARQYQGLKRELDVLKGPMSDQDFVDALMSSLGSHLWLTPWAQRKAEERQWEMRLSRLKAILLK